MKWLLDLGNTRCKSAQWSAGYLAQPQAADCDLASVGRVLDQLAPAAMPLAIWISSVAGEAANAKQQINMQSHQVVLTLVQNASRKEPSHAAQG